MIRDITIPYDYNKLGKTVNEKVADIRFFIRQDILLPETIKDINIYSYNLLKDRKSLYAKFLIKNFINWFDKTSYPFQYVEPIENLKDLFGDKFTIWFDQNYFGYKYCSYILPHFPQHFHIWWNPDKFNPDSRKARRGSKIALELLKIKCKKYRDIWEPDLLINKII